MTIHISLLLEVLDEGESVAVLLGHTGTDHISTCADQCAVS